MTRSFCLDRSLGSLGRISVYIIQWSERYRVIHRTNHSSGRSAPRRRVAFAWRTRRTPPIHDLAEMTLRVAELGRNPNVRNVHTSYFGGQPLPRPVALPPIDGPTHNNIDDWITAFSRELAPQGGSRRFLARRLGRENYILVESESTEWEWSVIVWLDGDRLPNTRQTERIVREVRRRFSRDTKPIVQRGKAQKSGYFDYVPGRLTDHGWGVDKSQIVRENALRSAIFRDGATTICHTLLVCKRSNWAQIGDRLSNIEEDLGFVRLNGMFGGELRRKYGIPNHCTGVITASSLQID